MPLLRPAPPLLVPVLALGLAACAAGSSVADDLESAAPGAGDTGPAAAACTPVAAVFFDLGETVATERPDGLFEAVPDAVTLLDDLRSRGVPTGLVTNVPPSYTMADLAGLLVDPSLLDLFDVVLPSSEAASPPKPSPGIFAEAVALLPDPPPIASTVFVTEERADLADGAEPTVGAQAAGMIGAHVSDRDPHRWVDHTVRSDQLAALATADWMSCAR